jgi:hypothetical protein
MVGCPQLTRSLPAPEQKRRVSMWGRTVEVEIQTER